MAPSNWAKSQDHPIIKFCFSFTNSNVLNMFNFSWQQANFVKLKDLRENCKTDLEMFNGMTSDKH